MVISSVRLTSQFDLTGMSELWVDYLAVVSLQEKGTTHPSRWTENGFNFKQLLSRNKLNADLTWSEYCCGHFSFHVCCLSTSVQLGGKLNVIASRPGLLTLEDYLLATDLLPALIFIFMAGLFGFLPSSLSSAATKVSWGEKESVFVSISFTP